MDNALDAARSTRQIIKAFQEDSQSRTGKIDNGVRKVLINVFLQQNQQVLKNSQPAQSRYKNNDEHSISPGHSSSIIDVKTPTMQNINKSMILPNNSRNIAQSNSSIFKNIDRLDPKRSNIDELLKYRQSQNTTLNQNQRSDVIDESNSLLGNYLKSLKAEYKQPKKQKYLNSEMMAISLDIKSEIEYYKNKKEREKYDDVGSRNRSIFKPNLMSSIINQQADINKLPTIAQQNDGQQSTPKADNDNEENDEEKIKIDDQTHNNDLNSNENRQNADNSKKQKRIGQRSQVRNFVFSTISRDQIYNRQRKQQDSLPEVGKYYPKYSLIVQRPLQVEFSKVFEKPGRIEPAIALKADDSSKMIRLKTNETSKVHTNLERNASQILHTQKQENVLLPSIIVRNTRNQKALVVHKTISTNPRQQNQL
ncbi:UNKNOWN [Stylonychia lemnae]|uniref:Uncharacterized protein n=1 Tax=Stylonychia lemnae TaxID=5949 RepID=A0A078B2W7_STYLE|nr:UNKNOWN [Stylonychia lemnae]|eukprot:CDW87572.1 UNKNOWN [Stylonychia lemnae]